MRRKRKNYLATCCGRVPVLFVFSFLQYCSLAVRPILILAHSLDARCGMCCLVMRTRCKLAFCWLLTAASLSQVCYAFVTPLPRNHAGVSSTSSLPATPVSDGTSQASSQNIFGVLSDATTGAAFSLLHAFDKDPIKDSSKNLRVLWVRALLNQRGMIKDDVAAKFLPPTTRGLVTTDRGAALFDPIIQFTEWIQARSEFIDSALDKFLSSPACTDDSGTKLECNIVLFGAGYDTRALRYRHKHNNKANFIEVDLPSVCEGKAKLYEKFQQDHDPEWDLSRYGSKFVPLDLNDCGGATPVSLVETLRSKGGLKKNVPTFFCWEAVLFYVNKDAVENIMQELFDFAKPGGNGNNPLAETAICFTDSLKPFVDVPFTNEARIFFDKYGLDLLEHRSRWGGAVHFAFAASRRGKGGVKGVIAKHVSDQVGGLVHSYMPTQSNNPKILENPSFDNVWYAIGYTWQIDGYATPWDARIGRKTGEAKFATRLWGEPIVVYRDKNGKLVAMADVCPHRSVPLSMGSVVNGELVCSYHGWSFGEGGACTDVPTLRTAEDGKRQQFLNAVTKANCGNNRAVVEHEGLVYVWRGNVLEADPSLLPTRRTGDMETVTMDTVLDYSVDYSYIVENNLDSPHLFYLHDGSVPPIESIGMLNQNLGKLKLTYFTDDCGMGHLGKLETGRPKKLIRFDPPNIVRHGGVSGFEEEFHMIPIAPQRTRVLLRQHLPRGPILSTISSIPFVIPLLTLIVNNWNYHISLEDSCVMQGQASRIEDLGAPRMTLGGLGDDLIAKYWRWRSKAHTALKASGQASPYYVDFLHHNGDGFQPAQGAIPTGTSFGDDPALVAKVRHDAQLRNTPLVTDNQDVDPTTGRMVGSWGIKKQFLQNTPHADFPPINYKQYASMLVYDNLVKNLFKEKEICPPGSFRSEDSDGVSKSVDEVVSSSTPIGVSANEFAVSSIPHVATANGTKQAASLVETR